MTGVSEKAIKPGVSFCLLVRAVLDKCASTEEAVKLLSDAHICSADNFLLADREGNLAVVEASPDRTRIRRPEKGDSFIVCTNHFVLSEMQEMENLEDRAKSNWDTLPRYETILAMLGERRGKIDTQYAQRILSNHSGYVCSHQKKIKLSTLWSIIATLNEPQILRAEGSPCRAKYAHDTRLNRALKQRDGAPRL
jgi:predicted choloylglycine hydrolase